MPEKQNLDAIFEAAAEISSKSERDVFLDEACGSDEACRYAVYIPRGCFSGASRAGNRHQ